MQIPAAAVLQSSAAPGAIQTTTLTGGTGAVLSNSRDVEAHTPVTFNPGVASTATCAVAISADNVTYSTLATWTVPIGTALDGTVQDVAVRLPIGYYLRLTVVNATVGTTTYY